MSPSSSLSTPSSAPQPRNRHRLRVIVGTIVVYQSALSVNQFVDSNFGNGRNHVQSADKTTRTSKLQSKTSIAEVPLYTPAPVEEYVVQNADRLGYGREDNPSACQIWKNHEAAAPISGNLKGYLEELNQYTKLLKAFNGTVKDLRLHLEDDSNICQTLELHKDGLQGIFRGKQLSMTASSGFLEPLLPPLRHPLFCSSRSKLMSLEYLVHDFAYMCRRLKRTSRNVLVDMGASLQFHGNSLQPAVYLTKQFQHFGFKFDHIYAYEISPTPPLQAFTSVPKELQAAYHWINIGVSADNTSAQNPLMMILENYNEDDFIVVKLDIDTSSIEIPLAKQLLTDDRLSNLIDSFYFEHHVHMQELAPNWKTSMQGTMKESLELFYGLRKKGIPAHSWV